MQKDAALDRVVAQSDWEYLAPLQQLRSLYWEMKKPQYRLRKPGEIRKSATKYIGRNRLGPIYLDARCWMLEQVLVIQKQVNQDAQRLGRPPISLINSEELARIHELIELKTYPDKWDGTEPHGDERFNEVLPDGSIQPLLF